MGKGKEGKQARGVRVGFPGTSGRNWVRRGYVPTVPTGVRWYIARPVAQMQTAGDAAGCAGASQCLHVPDPVSPPHCTLPLTMC